MAASLMVASLWTAPAAALERALVIGINAYPFLTENGEPANRDLEVAVADAERFTAFLTEDWGLPADAIRTLTDDKATKDQIIANFEEWLIAGTEPGDRVVFYYSGHGFQSADTSGDEADDPFDEGLAPHDTSGDLATGELDNILIDDEIGALISRLEGREVWVVVDACFAGTITRSTGVTEDGRSGGTRARTLTPRGPVRAATRSLAGNAKALAAQKTRTRLLQVVAEDFKKPENKDTSLFAWSATTSAQLAFERSDIGGGVFTIAFIDGLKNKTADFDGDGQVTAAELLTFVRKRSDDFCQSEPMCKDGSGLTPEVIAPKEHFTSVLAPPLFAAPSTVVAEAQAEAGTDAGTDAPTNADAVENAGGPTSDSVPVVGDKPAETASGLFAHENDFGIELSILPGPSLHLGQEVVISVASAAPGHLVLFDQGPDGALRQIFPNEYSSAQNKDGLIAPGGAIAIPDPSYGFAFEATEAGESVLFALVVDGDVNFGDLLTAHDDFDIVGKPDAFLAELAQYVLSAEVTPDPDKPNGRHHWAFATHKYTVE